MVTAVTGSSSRVAHMSQEEARIKLNKAATFPSEKAQGTVQDAPFTRKLPVMTEQSGKRQEVRGREEQQPQTDDHGSAVWIGEIPKMVFLTLFYVIFSKNGDQFYNLPTRCADEQHCLIL